MKLFFNASLTGKREYEASCQAIAEYIQKAGHSVLAPILSKRTIEDVSSESVNEASTYYRRLRKWIYQSDICVFEVSYPSTGIGHEISLALNFGKPVIALHVKKRDPFVLEAMHSENLQVLEYEISEVGRILDNAIRAASERMETRFNFFVPRRLVVYLDWISKNKRIPRAVYLRQLIRREMQRNRDFQS